MLFYGFDGDKNESSIIVHMNSIQLFTKIVKLKKGKKRQNIGFHTN
jgi:hypothetical protein